MPSGEKWTERRNNSLQKEKKSGNRLLKRGEGESQAVNLRTEQVKSYLWLERLIEGTQSGHLTGDFHLSFKGGKRNGLERSITIFRYSCRPETGKTARKEDVRGGRASNPEKLLTFIVWGETERESLKNPDEERNHSSLANPEEEQICPRWRCVPNQPPMKEPALRKSERRGEQGMRLKDVGKNRSRKSSILQKYERRRRARKKTCRMKKDTFLSLKERK